MIRCKWWKVHTVTQFAVVAIGPRRSKVLAGRWSLAVSKIASCSRARSDARVSVVLISGDGITSGSRTVIRGRATARVVLPYDGVGAGACGSIGGFASAKR